MHVYIFMFNDGPIKMKIKEKRNSYPVALTLPRRQKKKDQTVLIRTWEQPGSALLLYTSSGSRVMHLRAETRRRLNTVTHHMDALLTKGLCLFCGLFFFKSLSCASKGNEASRVNTEQPWHDRPGDKSLRALVRVSDALREIKRGWRECDGLMSWKSKAKISSND